MLISENWPNDASMVDFFTHRTVRWEKGKVVMIDQTKLPQTVTYVRCSRYGEVAECIKRMIVRGAPAIGVAAAMGLALAAQNSKARKAEDLLVELEGAASVLRETRPTAVNLFWAIERVLNVARKSGRDLSSIKRAIIGEAIRMADEDVEANKRLGKFGAELLEDGDVVLTHCSTGALATVGYGTALGVIRAAREQGKCIKVFTTETRPALQGSRLNAFELREDGFDVVLIADTAVGYFLSKGTVNKVIVGADRITKTGHVFNKIGTYQIALVSKKHGVPFFTAAPSSTIDLKSDWRNVSIEERSVDEVVKVGGRRIAPKGVVVMNPAFDLTPPELVDAIITDRGVLGAPYEDSIPRALSSS